MRIDEARTDAVTYACFALSGENADVAKKIIETGFPFSKPTPEKLLLPYADMVKIFKRDGFVDRFTGGKLFLPAVLKVLSLKLPDVFPWHANGKYTEYHQAHTFLAASVGKIIPGISSNDEKNLVTTSYMNKIAKANATLSDIGWRLFSLEEIADKRWDGMSNWFKGYVEKNWQILDSDKNIRDWYSALKKFD